MVWPDLAELQGSKHPFSNQLNFLYYFTCYKLYDIIQLESLYIVKISFKGSSLAGICTGMCNIT